MLITYGRPDGDEQMTFIPSGKTNNIRVDRHGNKAYQQMRRAQENTDMRSRTREFPAPAAVAAPAPAR